MNFQNAGLAHQSVVQDAENNIWIRTYLEAYESKIPEKSIDPIVFRSI
jgi:hypothetical protein